MSASSGYLSLEVISGNAPGNTITVEDQLVIGRYTEGAGRLAEDEEISRKHARISREITGDYAIEDLGSSNGTYVNGLRIQSPRLLAAGDSIETGATTLVVREIVRPQATQTPPSANDESTPGALPARSVSGTTPAEQPVPPLALRLEIDFDAREAQIALQDGGETVRMVFGDGGWRTIVS